MDFTPVTCKEASICLNAAVLIHICQVRKLLLNISFHIGNGEMLQDLCIKILKMYCGSTLRQQKDNNK